MAKAQLRDKQKQLREFIEQTNAEEGEEVLRRDSSREKIFKDITAETVDSDGKPERYDSKSTPPETKHNAPQATQENIEGNSSPEQNDAVQGSIEGEENVVSYSKGIGIFNETNLAHVTDISSQDIVDNLKTSQVGRETLEYAKGLGECIELNDRTIKVDDNGRPFFGEDNGKSIVIYLLSCDNAERAARTIVHECTHRKYGISQSQWAECVCFAQELKHKYKRDYLTIGEKRRIIKGVKEGYPEYNWRKGGLIHGRPKSHA